MHAVFLGASRGVGHHALLSLLSSTADGEWTTTLLLRKPETITSDPKFEEYLSSGRVKIVQGDATDEDDVRKLFVDKVDLVVTSVGAAPDISWRGISIDQPSLCKQSTLALLHVLAQLPKSSSSSSSGNGNGTLLPRVIAVSSMGIGENHKVLPWSMQIFYDWALAKPHVDKESLEYLLSRASSIIPTPPPPTPPSYISTFLLPEEITSVKESFLPEVIIVRGAFYVGGDSPPKGAELTRVGEEVQGMYTVRRSDIGRFIAEDCATKSEWVNKFPMVGY